MLKISFFGATDVGQKRTNNEDTFITKKIWDDKHVLCVVIDGVGGYEGGEVASEIAKKNIVEYLEKYTNGERIDLLKQAVVEANNKIVKQREIQPKYTNMSCVLTACIIQTEKNIINMVHVGDTRIYQYYKGKLTKLSHDHSLVGYREEIGNLTEDEAMNHPQRNIIERLLGDNLHQIDDENFLEASTFPLMPNSTFLLCSDGLSDMLKSEEMKSVLQENISLEKKVHKLIDWANEKGGNDNITVILVEINSDIPAIAESPKTKIDNATKNLNKEIQTIHEKTNSKNNRKIPFLLSITLGILLISLAVAVGWFGHKYLKTPASNSNPINNIYAPSIDENRLIDSEKDTLRTTDDVFIANDSTRYDTNDLTPSQVNGNESNKDTLNTNHEF